MSNSKKFAVVLSGCGVYDGAEIHEATLTLYAISRNGCSYDIFAPDIQQHHVVNHLTGEEMKETRNVLVESARIARGKIKALSAFSASDYDAIVFPGGFGAAKNLSSFAFDGANCTVNPEVINSIKAMSAARKPIGALCIAPAILAKVLGNVKLTIGQDAGTAAALQSLGASHMQTGNCEVVVDLDHYVVTSPCYMLDATIAQIGEGAENLVKAMIGLMG